ncbi:hypothetical protein D9758_012203 [Tetrapyrgos nigripes]|uniref:Uncharacterized protein n=1 Tax=Tetrapyrgos nigripes TaxID=182062 RepID=A0A8H5CHG6_9AGAR|nr:hypothetical protein D9758_012203 [Tetrapyrgos nigripes]
MTTTTVTMSTSSSDAKTLRSLYNRAARAFLGRDLPLTHSLINSAFDVLDSFQSPALPDYLRKWDILRITFETTVYSSPSPPNSAALPDSLQNLSIKTPQAFVSDLFERSLRSFTKTKGASKSVSKSTHNAAFDNPDSVLLPAPVLITLVYSSLKLECPESGRRMIEDWLAKRGDHLTDSELSVPSVYLSASASASRESINSSTESLPGPPGAEENGGYEKVIELYCIHVLPKLEQWDYAKEFLEYESEMSVNTRENLKSNLRTLHTQHMQSLLSNSSHSPSSLQLPPHPSSSPRSTSSNSSSPRTRSTSPAPSSSSSSSLSTTSTHTIVPATPKPNANGDALANGNGLGSSRSFTPSTSLHNLSTSHSHSRSTSSGSDSAGTITPTEKRALNGHGHGLNNPLGPYASSSSRSKRQGKSSSSKHHNHHPLNPNGLTPFSLPRPGSADTKSKNAVNASSSANSNHAPSSSSSTRSSTLGFQALIRASIDPYFDKLRSLGLLSPTGTGTGTGTRGWFVLVLVLVVFPVVSMILRRGRGRVGTSSAVRGSIGGAGPTSIGVGTGAAAGAVELSRIKQRLRNANASDGLGLGAALGRAWGEVVRVVVDTVRMGGSGLV